MATLSYYFAPVIVTAVCPFLFREKLTGRQILCFVMSTLGLVLVIGVADLGRWGGSDHIGVLFGLGAALLYAAVILLNKFIRGVAGIHRTLLQFLAAILVLLPYVACTGGFTLGSLDGAGWLCLLAFLSSLLRVRSVLLAQLVLGQEAKKPLLDAGLNLELSINGLLVLPFPNTDCIVTCFCFLKHFFC